MKKSIEKVKPTPELRKYYSSVAKWLSENNIEFKRLQPIGITVDIRQIPAHKVDEWINLVQNKT
jgi:hypothetical protein